MTQRSPDSTVPDPFAAMRSVRDANMEAWSKIMQQWTSTEAYSQATGALLDAYLSTSAPFRKLLEQTMTQVLTAYNMPVRSDVIGISERLNSLEVRIDDLDARLESVQRAVGVEKPVDLVDEKGHALHSGPAKAKES